jgi:hypothetical protein
MKLHDTKGKLSNLEDKTHIQKKKADLTTTKSMPQVWSPAVSVYCQSSAAYVTSVSSSTCTALENFAALLDQSRLP